MSCSLCCATTNLIQQIPNREEYLSGLGLNDSLGYLIESFKSCRVSCVIYYAFSLKVLESAAKAQMLALSVN